MTGTHWFGLCDYCHVAKTFHSQEARTFWEKNHPCDGRETSDDGDDTVGMAW